MSYRQNTVGPQAHQQGESLEWTPRRFPSGPVESLQLRMARRQDDDAWATFQQLLSAADAFVNRAPKMKRIDAERTALLDAIGKAQLTLSVRQLPDPRRPSKAAAETVNVDRLKSELQTATRRNTALQSELRGVKSSIETARRSVTEAEARVDKALTHDGDQEEAAA